MLSKNYKLLIVGLGLLLVCTLAKAQDEKLKAIFVYNFTRYLDWPQKSGNFVIVILGKSPIYAELADIAMKKKVGTQTIEVKTIMSAEEITDCQILYIAEGKTDLLPAIMQKGAGKNKLILTEKEGSCKNGAGINFVNKDGKLSFEIAKTNLTNAGIVVSSALFALGTVIN
jgi:hypothetical protein